MNEKTFIYDPNSLTGYFQITGFYTGASKETQSMFLTKTDNTHFKCKYAVTNSSTATSFKVSIKGVKF